MANNICCTRFATIDSMISWQVMKSIYIRITWKLTTNFHFWSLKVLKQVIEKVTWVANLKLLTETWAKGKHIKVIHSKLQPFKNLICHIQIAMLFLWERVVYYSIQFSYGCNSKYNGMICLPFAQVSVRSFRLPAKELFTLGNTLP